MTENLTVLLCQGTPSSSIELPGAVYSLQSTLAAVQAEELNRCLLYSRTDILAITNRPPVDFSEECQESLQALQQDPNLQLILHFGTDGGRCASAWQTQAALVAALRENPTARLTSVVLKRSALTTYGFANVSDPIWDSIIRAASQPNAIRSIGGSETSILPHPTYLPTLTPVPPGSERSWLKRHLDAFSPNEHLPAIRSQSDAVALQAGLYQLHNYLNASHECSQSIEGQGRSVSGDYWHAIMHRREPDYSNAKYWFRRVGTHPVFEPLTQAVELLFSKQSSPAAKSLKGKLLPNGRWDAFAFVDLCAECGRSQDQFLTELAEAVQWLEMQLLLDHTYRDAIG